MSADPKDRFSGVVADYVRFRPSYPDALIDWIIHEAGLAPGARVADVGCGTGISTRLFAMRGLDAEGVEPNDAMRVQAERQGGARYVKGQAEATGLPAASFDLINAAQCFHWFDQDAALAEFARIVRPGGGCCALRPGLRNRRVASFPNSQTFDLAGLLGRAHSMSYVVVGVKDRAGLDLYETCAVLWT